MKKIKGLLLNDKFILLLIVLNAFFIFLEGFDSLKEYGFYLSFLDNTITTIFIFEIITKFRHLGKKVFMADYWNIFDTILIGLSVPSLMMSQVYGDTGMSFDFILILRVTRIFKFIRFLKFFPNIVEVVNGVQNALKTSVIVFAGLFVYLFIVSIFCTFVYQDIVPQHFGNPLVSFYTIFQVFTIEGWYEIPNEIAENSTALYGGLTKALFVVLLLTGGLFGMSIVNSIFVDAMVSDNNDELVRKVKSLEDKIDVLLENMDERKNIDK